MILHPNRLESLSQSFNLTPLWNKKMHSDLPKVSGKIYFSENNFDKHNDHCTLFVEFNITEKLNYYRAEVLKHGGPTWQDSCVEVFVLSQDSKNYFNFECNSHGFCLTETGMERYNRIKLNEDTITQLSIQPIIHKHTSQDIAWSLKLGIPLSLLGYALQDAFELKGNLYKCASKASIPHYMSLFPIVTENPDFHRPEFFQPFFSSPSI